MKTENFVNSYSIPIDETVVIKKDGSVSFIPLQSIICYDKKRNAMGIGVSPDHFLEELNRYGEVHVAHDSDWRKGYDPLKKDDIVEIYSLKAKNNTHRVKISSLEIVPPKKGLKKILARLSNL